MKKYMTILVAVLLLTGAAFAREAGPSLLCDVPCPAPVVNPCPAPTPPPAPAVCEAPKPVEVCAPAPKPVEVCEPKVRRPRAKTVYVNETYTENVTKEGTMNEVRKRIAKRKVPMASTKEVSEVNIIKNRACSGKAPRLARPVTRKVVPITVMVEEEYEETYLHPVKYQYEEPVTKTRKVKQTYFE